MQKLLYNIIFKQKKNMCIQLVKLQNNDTFSLQNFVHYLKVSVKGGFTVYTIILITMQEKKLIQNIKLIFINYLLTNVHYSSVTALYCGIDIYTKVIKYNIFRLYTYTYWIVDRNDRIPSQNLIYLVNSSILFKMSIEELIYPYK